MVGGFPGGFYAYGGDSNAYKSGDVCGGGFGGVLPFESTCGAGGSCGQVCEEPDAGEYGDLSFSSAADICVDMHIQCAVGAAYGTGAAEFRDIFYRKLHDISFAAQIPVDEGFVWNVSKRRKICTICL